MPFSLSLFFFLHRMCRDILNSCVRNTEEAEKISRGVNGPGSSGASGRGQGKGVWGMIEESELAKTIRQGEEEKVFVNSPPCYIFWGEFSHHW